MGENSNIEWCHHTFNPWSGCTKVSPACEHCYAEVNYSVKMRGVKWGKRGNRIIASDSMWKQPLAWNRKAEAEGVRKRVFCASLADVFESSTTLPAEAAWDVFQARRRVFGIVRLTPYLDWLFLTKRPENVMSKVPEEWLRDGFPANVWIGTTVENQEWADKRIPHLLKIPAKVRFLSVEPMLGPVDLEKRYINVSGGYCYYPLGGHYADRGETDENGQAMFDGRTWKGNGIDWVICGGESGNKARPMHPDWVRSLRDQCVAAGVPFHFKQWGNWQPLEPLADEFPSCGDTPDGIAKKPVHDWDDYRYSVNVGKHVAGRILEGRTWDDLPVIGG